MAELAGLETASVAVYTADATETAPVFAPLRPGSPAAFPSWLRGHFLTRCSLTAPQVTVASSLLRPQSS